MAFTTKWSFNIDYDPSLVVEKQYRVGIFRAPTTPAAGGREGADASGPLGSTGELVVSKPHGDGTNAGFWDPREAVRAAILELSADYLLNGLADTVAPVVAITDPEDEESIAAGEIEVTASATDDVGVASVQFKVNGVNEGAAVTSAPYTITWDATLLDPDDYELTAVATDANGNSTTSEVVTVTIT